MAISKQTTATIAMIVLVTSASILITWLLCDNFMGKPDEATFSFESVEPISAEVVQPDKAVFNRYAINPTYELIVGSDGSLENAE